MPMDSWHPLTTCRHVNRCWFGRSAENLVGFAFHLLLFVSDEWDDVFENVERCYSRVACSGDCLHGRDYDCFEAEAVVERFQRKAQNGSCAVWIRHYEAIPFRPTFLIIYE